MFQIKCMYRDTSGLLERVTILAEADAGGLYEVELGADVGRLTETGKTTLRGWGTMDGEAVEFDRAGVGGYVIPSDELDRIGFTAREG